MDLAKNNSYAYPHHLVEELDELETPRQDEKNNPKALAQKHTCAQKVETATRIFAEYLTSQGKKI